MTQKPTLSPITFDMALYWILRNLNVWWHNKKSGRDSFQCDVFAYEKEIRSGFATSELRNMSVHSDEGLTLEMSSSNSLRWPIYVVNSINTKLPQFI